jgi:hypothetical protein
MLILVDPRFKLLVKRDTVLGRGHIFFLVD